MKLYKEVSVTAPAQVANIFGYFDCAGFLCRTPPQNESAVGGVGDVITVQFSDRQLSSIEIEYLLRTCDRFRDLNLTQISERQGSRAPVEHCLAAARP